MEVISTDFENNMGVPEALTALAYADDKGKMTLRHVKFRENFIFTVSLAFDVCITYSYLAELLTQFSVRTRHVFSLSLKQLLMCP